MDESPPSAYQGPGTLDDVIARSNSASCCEEKLSCTATPTVLDPSVVQKIALDLPEVVRIPGKKRTFHLNHEDLETLVRPLLSCHWHVARVGNVVDDLQAFSLNKLFRFKDFRSAVEFFDTLADIQEEENHHARVTVDYANVYVSAHTHVAYQRSSDTDTDAKPIKVPGLTARDVRFAVKVERLHERFLGDGRAVTKVPVDSASLQAWSMEQLRQRYPASCG